MIKGLTPQLGVNDDTALLVNWTVKPGDRVAKGDVVGQIETTKAVYDIEAEGAGFFAPLAEPGARVAVGQVIYALTDSADAKVDVAAIAVPAAGLAMAGADAKQVARWTKKAELLAKEHGIDIAQVPAIGVVREADVLMFVKSGGRPAPAGGDLVDGAYPANRPNRIMVIGGGRGAVQVLDILRRCRHQSAVGLLDDDRTNHGRTIMGVPIVGTLSEAATRAEKKEFDSLVIAFTNDLAARRRVFEEMKERGLPFTNVIDPSVQVHANVRLGEGNVIIANGRLGACASVGDNNFLSAYVNIEHHNTLGSHCTFGPGVMTSSRVDIGDGCRFGTGVFIEPGVRIGAGCIIASGAILASNVPEKHVVKVHCEMHMRPIDAAGR
jgi:sugar O-acyltransferase (sialic acid O-acetyltransferase NeuD family)